MARAKDAIADEHWLKAIGELQAAAGDAREPNRAEAMFWLAHCQNQTGEQVAALETIARLQREFPGSPWLRFAESLRLEIAQKLNRDDVLWQMARPPAPPAVAAPALAATPAAPPAPQPPPARVPRVIAPARPATPAPPAPPAPGFAPFPPMATPRGGTWVASTVAPDTDLRILALGSLMQAHPDRVIPLLQAIALDPASPGDGRRAVFVLAQSPTPEAQMSVLEVAKRAAEPVRVEAVKELGRYQGPVISRELLKVYAVGTPRVKRQVVASLGDRADRPALLHIVRSEADPTVRNTAIVTLGRAGGREELRGLYAALPPDGRKACLMAFFNARDEDGLIHIAETDHDAAMRQEARNDLRLLGTAKALAYLQRK